MHYVIDHKLTAFGRFLSSIS